MTPLFKKLNFKDHNQIIAINAPKSFETELAVMSDFASIIVDIKKAKDVDFAMCFALTQKEIESFLKSINKKLKGDTIIWICYPKGTSKKYKCEFNRDNGFAVLGDYGLEPVRQVAIDEDWSALRFRKVEFIKTITRRESFAITAEAKKRTTQKNITKDTLQTKALKNGDQCTVIAGTHKGKSGIVQDLKTSKTGHITITVLQSNGVRFKTLGRNVEVTKKK